MRKILKRQARGRLKKTYWLMVVLCLIMAVFSFDYASSLDVIRTDTSEDAPEDGYDAVLSKILEGRIQDGDTIAQNYLEAQKSRSSKVGIIAVEHSRGILGQVIDGISSASILNTAYRLMKNISNSDTISYILFFLLTFAFSIFLKVFFYNTLFIALKRFVMELRMYDKVPMSRFLFLIRVKRIINAALTLILKNVYYFFWSLTIVGFFVKSRSYMLVPYIIAENPDIKPKQAITLSRKMMHGHKWEAFVLDLSFIGWNILEFFTYGISGMLYSNPYHELTRAEYYAHIRSLAKSSNIPGIELLNDTFLYEKADTELLKQTYADVQPFLYEAETPVKKHAGFRGLLENAFGLTLFYDEDEINYQKIKAKQNATRDHRQIMKQNMYPFRLFTIHHKNHLVKLSSLTYDRHYSLFSIILIFFSMSFVGWCWEVSLHLLQEGVFRNRGVNHGPWLPIYGFGCVLILIFLYRFRNRPLIEFAAAVILCGIVEYSSAWYLETTHNGTKWWDYSGYFMNIDGRVCAEGLLIFGLGGLAIVYLLAPVLDNIIRKVPKKVTVIVACVLTVIFLCDSVYSSKHPNTGKGITDYDASILLPDTESTDSTQC
ncbi:MAG: DUF975 family protein [Lachnospiraceae bacterium]|nr:DUF975 family protein [Lachnospiraceae bacterium]